MGPGTRTTFRIISGSSPSPQQFCILSILLGNVIPFSILEMCYFHFFRKEVKIFPVNSRIVSPCLPSTSAPCPQCLSPPESRTELFILKKRATLTDACPLSLHSARLDRSFIWDLDSQCWRCRDPDI